MLAGASHFSLRIIFRRHAAAAVAGLMLMGRHAALFLCRGRMPA